MARAPHYEDEEGSLNAGALVKTAYGAFRQAYLGCGQEAAEFDDLPEEVQAAFLATVADVLPQIEAADGIKWSELASHAHSLTVRRISGGEELDMAHLAPHQSIAWEALVRHLTNAFLGFADESDKDPEGHEAHWFGWAQEQLARKGLTQADLAILREQQAGGG